MTTTVAPTTTVVPATTTTVDTSGFRTVPIEEDEEEKESKAYVVTFRFVAFGDVDGVGGVGFGVVPDMRVAIIEEADLGDWWSAVGGDALGIRERIPSGVQVQGTAAGLESAPAQWVTTGPDGTAEVSFTFTEPKYSLVCVVSPVVDNLIAGCTRHVRRIWEVNTFYVHFSHGRAFLDIKQDGEEQYQQFLAEGEQFLAEGEPVTRTRRSLTGPRQYTATVTIVSFSYGDVVGFNHFSPDIPVAIIEDADIGAWWTAISDNGEVDLNLSLEPHWPDWARGKRHVDRGIYYDPETLEAAPARIVTTGPDGSVEVELPVGTYLFCNISKVLTGCDYEYISTSYDNIFTAYSNEQASGLTKISKNRGRKAMLILEEARRACAQTPDPNDCLRRYTF